jgi:hypothetical protein
MSTTIKIGSEVLVKLPRLGGLVWLIVTECDGEYYFGVDDDGEGYEFRIGQVDMRKYTDE